MHHFQNFRGRHSISQDDNLSCKSRGLEIMSFYYQHSIKCELPTSYSPTCIWSSSTIWSCRWGTISSFNLQGISSLLLSVEHLLGEDLTRLGVDLEGVLPLVPNAVHDVVVHLVIGKRPVLVDGINPKKIILKKA